ncbi:MAG: hypothetical protein WCG47_10430, partial [Dermatophilaceae bacterium]
MDKKEAAAAASERLAALRDAVGPAATKGKEAAMDAAAVYGPIAKEKAQQAAEAAAEAARTYGPVVAEKAQHAAEA